MARHDVLYDRALYYDVALEREVGPEVDFIIDVFEEHARRPLRSVLEIGCGPGYHARALARRGIDVVGLDVCARMIELAKSYALEEDVDVTWLVEDMRSFTLDDQVDMAVCLFDGIDALLTDPDFDMHLNAVGNALREGGLYLIDCTHPRDCSLAHYGDYSYRGTRGDLEVEILWGTNDPQIDPVTGIAEVETRMIVHRDGRREVIDDLARERCFTAQELRLLIDRNPQFRLAEWYGAFSLRQPLDNSPQSHRMIALLRRQTL